MDTKAKKEEKKGHRFKTMTLDILGAEGGI
jgi:hypothetical protein